VDAQVKSPKRVLVIGLDGATFDLLTPWCEQGVLPNLAALVARGVSGPLRSVFPPVTAPAWVSFQTGKNPGKHGIFEFLQHDGTSFELVPVNATMRDGLTIWDLLTRAERKVAILGVPVTYPPRPVNGIQICGFLAPRGSRDFTHPTTLLDEIESRFGPFPLYHSQVYAPGQVGALLDEAFHHLRYKRKLDLALLVEREWDFAIAYFEGADRLQHELWHLMEPRHAMHDAQETREHLPRLTDFYRELDATVGDLVAVAGPDSAVVVMSDHGFGPIDRYLNFNVWLLENGLLALRSDALSLVKRALFRAGITPSLAYKMSMRLGFAKHRLKKGVTARSSTFALVNKVFLSLANIDWRRTRAFSRGNYGQIFVNLKGREPFGSVNPGREYEETVHDIIEKLRATRDPATGEPILGEVYRKEEIYSGRHVERMPDVVFIPRDMRYKALGIVDFTTRHFIEPTFGNSGDHRMDGIFIAGGPPFAGPGRAEGLSLIDLTPTILHLLGLPVPIDMDGRVLTETLDPAWSAAHPIVPGEPAVAEAGKKLDLSEAEREEIRNRLRGMGYVS
jgi:predicted AlkP superfamily phosphohydrolase/phosphomutase